MKSKNKSKKIIKVLFAMVLIVLVAIIAIFISVSNDMKEQQKKLNESKAETTTSAYYDIKDEGENNPIHAEVTSTKIELDDSNYKKFLKTANAQKLGYTYESYYGIEEALKQPYVQNTPIEYNLEVLDENNNIDIDKLTEVAIRNRKLKKLPILCAEIDDAKTRELCGYVAKALNDNKDKCDIKKVATLLSHFRIFEKKGSTAFAYVTQDINMGFNTTIFKIYENMGSITGTVNFTNTSIFTHESMHLIQLASSFDGDNEEIENLGCYRIDRTIENEKPNPLWIKWIIEGSADTAMQSYLKTDNKPLCYPKKITYINSVLMPMMFNDGFDKSLIEQTTYCENFDEMRNILGIKTDDEFLDFMKLAYTIEICQEGDEGFFTEYQKATGRDVSVNDDVKSDERFNIILACRSEAENVIVNSYYKNLAKYVKENVVDLETVFFLARLCEIDTFTHLQYTNKNYYSHQTSNIENHYELQQALFKAIAQSSNISLEDINKAYDNYKMYVCDEDGKTTPNCNWQGFTKEQREFIEYANSFHSYTRFVRLKTMKDFNPKTE